jgi:hypothetical protein
MQIEPSTTRPQSDKIPALRSACMHAAQSRLLLLRVATETSDPLELRDLAGVLQYVVTEIEQLGRRTR